MSLFKKHKEYYYSGILSILLIAFLLTVFELGFFYLVSIPEVNSFVKRYKKKGVKMIDIMYKDKKNCLLEKDINLNKIIEIVKTLDYNTIENNKNVRNNVIFIITLLILFIIIVIILIKKRGVKERLSTKKVIDHTFIPNTIFTIIFIVLFQIYFYFRITKDYKYPSINEILYFIKQKNK